MAKSDTSIGRAFLEIGANIQPLVKDIDSAVRVMGEADAKLAAQGTRIAKSFENAYDPAAKLEKQLVALGASGKSAADLIKVYGERVLSTTDVTLRHGTTLSPVMEKYHEMALAIQDAGGASESLAGGVARTTEQLQEARWASMLLTRQIGVQLPEALQGFLAKSSLLGPVLGSIFKATAWGTLAVAIWEAGKRLYEWADGSEEAAKKTRELTDELQKQVETFDQYAARIERARQSGAMIGLTGAEKGRASLGFKREELERARLELDALSGQYNRLYVASQQYEVVSGTRQPTAAALEAMKQVGEIQDRLRKTENEYRVLQIEVVNAEKELALVQKEQADRIERDRIANLEKMLELRRAGLSEEEKNRRLVEAMERLWGTTAARIGDAAEEQRKLFAELDRIQPRSIFRPDQSGSIDDLLRVDSPITRAVAAESSRTGGQVSTIFTDFMGGIARAAVELKGFASVARSAAEALIRMALESVWRPGAGSSVAGSLANGFSLSGIKGIFSRGSAVSAPGGTIPGTPLPFTGPARSSFASSTGGQLAVAGGATVGTALMSDAWKRGSVAEGLARGAMAGASIGTMITPGIGTAIGAAVGALAGAIVGMFGGGERRRQLEAERRERIQESYMYATPQAVARSSAFGHSKDAELGADIQGRMRAYRPAPVVVVQVEAMDVQDFERRTGYVGQLINRAALLGGSGVPDTLAYAAG